MYLLQLVLGVIVLCFGRLLVACWLVGVRLGLLLGVVGRLHTCALGLQVVNEVRQPEALFLPLLPGALGVDLAPVFALLGRFGLVGGEVFAYPKGGRLGLFQLVNLASA